MSKNHGRRILIEGREARDLTRSELYDVLAKVAEFAPGDAENLFGIRRLPVEEATGQARAHTVDGVCAQRARA